MLITVKAFVGELENENVKFMFYCVKFTLKNLQYLNKKHIKIY